MNAMNESARPFLICDGKVIEVINQLDRLLGQVSFNVRVANAIIHELRKGGLMLKQPDWDYLNFGKPVVEHFLKAAIGRDDGNAASVR